MLLESISFASGLVLPNRIALAPMTNMQSHADGTIGDDELHWLLSRADGGFALVTTCAAHVAKDGQGWIGELGAYDDRHVEGLARLAGRVRDRGAAPLLQIFHGGMRADPSVSRLQPWSAVATEGVRAATVDDIATVIERFGDAAARAWDAGMAGVEIHGAHGYLLTQFLSSTNVREDGWGGALENRARLIRAVTVSSKGGLDAALAGAKPGDVITLENGTYAGNFTINASGTAENPIVIGGQTAAGVTLDGGGCTGCNVLEVYGSFVHVERMTIAHAERAIRGRTRATPPRIGQRAAMLARSSGRTGRRGGQRRRRREQQRRRWTGR